MADRFVALDEGAAIDLATGERVLWQPLAAADAAEGRRWAVRCDALRELWHPSIASLVDYGEYMEGGAVRQFEAWTAGQPWRGPLDRGRLARAAAASFLNGCGLSAGPLARVRASARGPIVVPDSETGYPCAPSDAPARSLDECGLALVPRAAVRALAEACTPRGETRPSVLSLRGAAGAGLSTALADIARAARLDGVVPVAVDLLDRLPALRDLLAGRSVLLIAAAGSDRRGWTEFLERALATMRAQVLMFVDSDERSGVPGIGLEKLAADVLVSAVRPGARAPALDRRIRRAARTARGLPGRFARLLWGCRRQVPAAPTVRCGRSRAAEQSPAYGCETDTAAPAPGAPATWPAPGELALLRRRLEAGRSLVVQGRHAPGERALRQAVGALARRGDWAHAARGGLVLADALVRRGYPQAALDALRAGAEHRRRVDDEEIGLDAAVIAAHAWIDLGRCDEATAAAGSAVAAARARADRPRTAAASVALARGCFWRGAYADAARVLAILERDEVDARLATAISCHAARSAVGCEDVATALSLAAEAVGRAEASGVPALVAQARCAALFVRVVAGDLDAAEPDLIGGLRAARLGHDALRAVRLRLLGAERARRAGRRGDAASVVRRLERLTRRLPPLVRARCALISELVAGDGREPEAPAVVAGRHAAAAGLEALRLFGATAPERAPAHNAALVRGVVKLLALCQRAEDEAPLLVTLCAELRRQLHAAAVAIFARDRRLVAADGAAIDASAADRAMAADLVVEPRRAGDRLEAAAPIRCGAETIGALAARWTIGTPHDLVHAPATLAMAAAAAVPLVAALCARAGRAAPGGLELIGISPAMDAVRLAIERAAAAPFAVLVQAESGSGKELAARALHRAGPRRERPFCALNCAALPDDLIEAELFGHARGAFTGAVAERAGVFEEAHGGTLFLDEVGELSPRGQAKLLRVVQDGELRRVGENVSRRVDVRLVAATNRDLRAETAAGRFRLDLLYRLDVVRIAIPPLRERREDIPLLAEHFWRQATERLGSRATLSAATIAALTRYDWPGNVRELQNVLAALAVRSPKRGVVSPDALPPPFEDAQAKPSWRLEAARRVFEEQFVRAALVRAGGHRSRAAQELGVTRQGLAKLMTRLGIQDG
ncbi:MAG: sigma 54-interacting transcriptional regulator [Betaproteobacteria bacterium]